MKVLIACEFSGVVRRSFRAMGHDAWSCDLLVQEDYDPANPDTHQHYQSDALAVLNDCLIGAKTWDLLIAHPPCTYLCNSGVRWLAPGGVLDDERHELMQQACDFFAALYWAKVPRVAVENPVMHKYARDYLASAWKVPAFTQSIQPWQHGEPEVKRTCLWLRGLPDLVPSNVVTGRNPRVHHASPGPERWRERSRTLPGIAKAMAEQWGGSILQSATETTPNPCDR